MSRRRHLLIRDGGDVLLAISTDGHESEAPVTTLPRWYSAIRPGTLSPLPSTPTVTDHGAHEKGQAASRSPIACLFSEPGTQNRFGC